MRSQRKDKMVASYQYRVFAPAGLTCDPRRVCNTRGTVDRTFQVQRVPIPGGGPTISKTSMSDCMLDHSQLAIVVYIFGTKIVELLANGYESILERTIAGTLRVKLTGMSLRVRTGADLAGGSVGPGGLAGWCLAGKILLNAGGRSSRGALPVTRTYFVGWRDGSGGLAGW